MRRIATMFAHFLTNALPILGRHLPPLLASFLTQGFTLFRRHLLPLFPLLLARRLALFRRHLPPMFAHLLAHLLALFGRQGSPLPALRPIGPESRLVNGRSLPIKPGRWKIYPDFCPNRPCAKAYPGEDNQATQGKNGGRHGKLRES